MPAVISLTVAAPGLRPVRPVIDDSTVSPRRPRQVRKRRGHGRRGRTPGRPLKRPSQQRARFTVAAIYEAFVRIWQARGWAGVTTRAVALEAGARWAPCEYFPNKEALLSGFVRHAIERLLARIEDEAAHAPAADWREQVGRSVRLCCSAEDGARTAYDRDMMALEARIAEPKHHQRFFEELCAAWLRVLAACPDLPRQPDAAVVASPAQAVWGRAATACCWRRCRRPATGRCRWSVSVYWRWSRPAALVPGHRVTPGPQAAMKRCPRVPAGAAGRAMEGLPPGAASGERATHRGAVTKNRLRHPARRRQPC